MAENPLLRLAALDAGGEAFLQPHQVLAAERLSRLVERARLTPRLTMSYDPARVGGGSGANTTSEISDAAANARRRLGQIAAAMPADCWGVWSMCVGSARACSLWKPEGNGPGAAPSWCCGLASSIWLDCGGFRRQAAAPSALNHAIGSESVCP